MEDMYHTKRPLEEGLFTWWKGVSFSKLHKDVKRSYGFTAALVGAENDKTGRMKAQPVHFKPLHFRS